MRPYHTLPAHGARADTATPGSFGAPPTPVQGAANVLADRVEENPDRFMRLEWYALLGAVRARLAAFLGARREEIVLVQNATVATAVVLRNFEWRAGDVLVGGACALSRGVPGGG